MDYAALCSLVYCLLLPKNVQLCLLNILDTLLFVSSHHIHNMHTDSVQRWFINVNVLHLFKPFCCLKTEL